MTRLVEIQDENGNTITAYHELSCGCQFHKTIFPDGTISKSTEWADLCPSHTFEEVEEKRGSFNLFDDLTDAMKWD